MATSLASLIQGYDKERFETTINRNFLCLICSNVLRDPVQCARNEHHFCRACITKYLEYSQKCPTCSDELTVETLTKAPRMINDYLNELNIHCQHANRGCHETVQLQHLDRHEVTCGFAPVVCTNEDCSATVNKRDLIQHERELCEFRKLKFHSFGETAKTSAAGVKMNMITMEKKMTDLEKNMARNMAYIEGKLEAVNNEVSGLKRALTEGFNEMKDVLVTIENITKDLEQKRKGRKEASGDKQDIIVAGGVGTDSVEIFNWRQRKWSQIQSLPKKLRGATSLVYNNQLTIAGGWCSGSVDDSMMRMNIDPNADLSTDWSECLVKLPATLAYHSSVLYNDQLIVTGGYDGNTTSDRIHEVQLAPPYTVNTLSRMPEPRQHHNTEIFENSLLIVGGIETGLWRDSLSSVVLYDIKENEFKELAPLPYEVSQMATVKWGDNIIVIGGVDKHEKSLNAVIIYNVKTQQYHSLPPMKCKRYGCAAVVIQNNIVVLGGNDDQGRLNSVEAFNFDRYTWELELPEMSTGRCYHTAVAV